MQSFGSHIRATREALASSDRTFTLRKVAGRVGIEPAYLSKIERGVFPPPSELTICKIADALGEDSDVLLAMAGKLSHELRQIILSRPKLIANLLRHIKDAPDYAIIQVARELKDGNW